MTVSACFYLIVKLADPVAEKQLLQLLDDYELRQLNTHLENLNRFLAFIGKLIFVSHYNQGMTRGTNTGSRSFVQG